MNLQKIVGCCSMLVISDNPSSEYSKASFKRELKRALKKHSRQYPTEDIYPDRIKTLVMITNHGFWNRLEYRRFGFKRAYSYKGNSKAKAHVMHLNFKTNLSDYLYN